MVKRHSQLMLLMLAVTDVLVVPCAWVGAYLMADLAVRLRVKEAMRPFEEVIPAMIVSMIVCVPVFSRFGLYEPKRVKTTFAELSAVARAILIAWCLTYVIASLMKRAVTIRFVMASLLPAWIIAEGSARMVARGLLHRFRRRGWNLRYAAIAGTGRVGQTLFHCLKRNAWTGIEPLYFVQDPKVRDSLLGLDVLGPYGAIEEIVAARPVDIVFVAMSGREHSQVEELLNRLSNTEVDVRVVPDMLSFHFLKHELGQLGNLPIVTLTYTPLEGWNGVLKRALDVVFSALALLVLLGPMLVIALLVKLTAGGPVFYRQARTSLGGKAFQILKFRTMVENAEKETGPVWAADDDPRVTGLGRVLRRTGLDELPQLVNVLLGDMSLVGPRPERPELIERFRRQIPRYMLRHHAKAGLTGWAQVNGLRGQTSLRKRVQYDMFYICNWSLGLDVRILLTTLLHFLAPHLRKRQRPA